MKRVDRKFLFGYFFFLVVGCAPTRDSLTPDDRNAEGRLIRIVESFRKLHHARPFSMGFIDAGYSQLTIDLVTDSLTYVFHFNPEDPGFPDTLRKFGYPSDSICQLAQLMNKSDCIWISQEPAYDKRPGHEYTCLSFKPIVGRLPPYNQRYPVYVFSKKGMPPFRNDSRVGPRKLHRINDTLAIGLEKYFR